MKSIWMKTRHFAVLTAFLSVVGPSDLVAQSQYELVDVSPSVVMARNTRGSNMTCFALSDGLVFVDTGLSTKGAAEFRALMEERFDRGTQALFLTHAHLDHFLGMAAFADVDIIASEASKPLFERQLAIDFDNPEAVAYYATIFPTFAEDYPEATLASPEVWFDDELALGEGEDRLLLATAGGHTTGSSFAYLAAEGVIATGDLVQVERYPYFGDPTTDLTAWIASLERWHDLKPNSLCPGHGPVADRAYLPPIWTYFEDLMKTLAGLKKKGLTLAEVASADLPKGYWPEDLPEPRWWPYCIARAWEQVP